jgi:hypothetical protein
MSRRAEEAAKDWRDEFDGLDEPSDEAEYRRPRSEGPPPEGHRWVYVIQTAHWVYDDATFEFSAWAGDAIRAYACREKAEAAACQMSRLHKRQYGVVATAIPLEDGE